MRCLVGACRSVVSECAVVRDMACILGPVDIHLWIAVPLKAAVGTRRLPAARLMPCKKGPRSKQSAFSDKPKGRQLAAHHSPLAVLLSLAFFVQVSTCAASCAWIGGRPVTFATFNECPQALGWFTQSGRLAGERRWDSWLGKRAPCAVSGEECSQVIYF